MAHMLAIVRYRLTVVPPYLYMHCRILGEGVYSDSLTGATPSGLFGMMLDALRKHIGHHVFTWR